MANEKEYFVSVTVEWGKQNGESQKAESVGGQNWGNLTYDQSVAVQNAVVIPGVIQMLEDAGALGLEMVGDEAMVAMINSKKAK